MKRRNPKSLKESRKLIQKINIMSYPLVRITNSTNYLVTGKVSYMSIFCSDDEYSVAANSTWEASSRGVCLLQNISAVVVTPNGEVFATPYSSSGTSYSQFAVIQTGTDSFAVTRIVNLADENVPEDYVEPTSKQK